MTILGHQIEYDTENVVIDDGAEQTLYEIIADAMWEEKYTGTIELHMEDEQEREIKVMVRWKIVNPEAEKWKNIAKKLYDAAISEDEWSIYHLTIACNKYKEAIKEQ